MAIYHPNLTKAECKALYEARYVARGALKGADGKFYYTANGTTARSITALCRELSLDPALVTKRLRKGWTLDQAVNLPSGAQPPDRKYLVDASEAHAVGVASQMRDALDSAWAGDARASIIQALKIGAAYLKES